MYKQTRQYTRRRREQYRGSGTQRDDVLPKYTRADGCVSQKIVTRLVQWPLLHYYNTTTDAAAAGAREAFGRSRSGGSLDSLIPELSLEAVPQTRLSVVVRGWEK